MTVPTTVSTTGPTPGHDPVQAPHWTVGDRLAAFRALLPGRPAGPVVLMVSDDLAPHLQAACPGAVVLSRGRRAGWPEPGLVVHWDGRRAPVAPGSAALVVVDATGHDEHDEQVAAALVADDGVLAVLGSEGPYRVYPALDRPELVWRRGWPVQVTAGPVPWLRRRLGLGIGRGSAVPRLRLSRDVPTLADLVVDDLARATGDRGELVGLVTGGRVVLRVRTADGDVAVRLALTDVGRETDDVAERVAADVPEAAAYLPVVVARGETAGHPWVATEWTPRRRRPLAWPWPGRDRQWQVAGELAGVLAARSTGVTGPGWAVRWAQRAHVVPATVRERWAERLTVLDDETPTGWCHGDLWPGNVLLDGTVTTVIDWDNGAADAPQGLDQLLVRALQDADDDRLVSEVLLGLAADPEPVAGCVVAGRVWTEHDAEHRTALALAAVLLYLRNRSLHDLGPDLLERHLQVVDHALGGSTPAAPEPAPASPPVDPEAGRTARGALWLATNGVVVKTSQTVVLLTLAAVLAPASLGLVALGTLIANVSAVVTSLGTASALVYWRGDVRRAARTAVTIGVATGGALAVVLWAAAPLLARALNAGPDGAAVIRGLTVTLPCLAVAAVTNELLRRRLAFVRRIIPDTVSSVVGAVVAIVLAASGHGVMALVVGQVVQAVLTMLLAWVVHPPVLPGWHRDDVRGLLSYGGPYAGANLLELVQLNVDYLIVSWVLGGAALGQYSLAFRIAFMPYLMIVVVTTGAAFPYLCRQHGAALGRATVTVMGATLTLVTPICLGIALFADDLVLLGDKWRPGVPVVAWLALYAGLLSVGQMVQTALNASGRPAVSMLLRLGHLVLLTTVLLVAAPHGVTAVAVGQVLAVVVVALVALVVARLRVTGFSLRALVAALRPTATAAVVMAGVVLVTRPVLDPHAPSLSGLLVVGLLGVAAYATTVWVLDRDRLRQAGRLVRRPS